jgi:hypothetical protein
MMIKRLTTLVAALLMLTLSAGPVSAHPIEEWTVLVIAYREVNAECGDNPVTARMNDAEWELQNDIAADFRERLETWRKGWPTDVSFIRRDVLTNLESPNSNGNCMPGPSVVPEPIQNFSTVYVLVPWTELDGHWWMGGVLGFATGCCYDGGYYAVGGGAGIPYDQALDVMIHEFLHTTKFWFGDHGAFQADPHDRSAYGYSTERGYYEGIIASDLPDLNGDGHPDGISHFALHTGAPN